MTVGADGKYHACPYAHAMAIDDGKIQEDSGIVRECIEGCNYDTVDMALCVCGVDCARFTQYGSGRGTDNAGTASNK